MTVLAFTTTCPACKDALHDRCWQQHLGEIFDFECVPCNCGCRDEFGELTVAALTEMMRKHPDALARRIRFDAAFERGSIQFHSHPRHPVRFGF